MKKSQNETKQTKPKLKLDTETLRTLTLSDSQLVDAVGGNSSFPTSWPSTVTK